MNYIDIAILIFLVFGAVLGFKRGFTNQLVRTVGFIIILVVAFNFKDIVSNFLYMNLPFFKFGGYFKGVSVINILVYEIIAFFVVLTILGIGLRVLLFATSLFETLLNATIILGIPSKILGAFVGVVQSYLVIFIILFLASLPVFEKDVLVDSEYGDNILKKTIVLSSFSKKTVEVADEIYLLKDKYTKSQANEFNLEALDITLKYKIVSVKTVDDLVEKEKLEINNIESVIKKYR